VSDDAKREALQGASDNVNPTLTSQQNAGQPQTQPPARQPGPEVNNTQGAAPPTGTVVIVIRRPQ
jgi:hypothetical protein